MLKYASLCFLSIMSMQASASDWMPLASANYDNRLDFSITAGVARRFAITENFDSLYHYADMTIGQEGRLLTFGVADTGEGVFTEAGLGFLQIENGSKNNYAGFVFTGSIIVSDSSLPMYVSVRFGLLSQTSDYKDIRALVGIGIGI